MIRRFVQAALPLTLAAVALFGCHRHRKAESAPPAEQMPPPPPPPPPPCDVIGSWQAQPPLPLGPQQIDIAPTDRAGVYDVRAKNGTSLGVATIQTTTGAAVDTQVTNPIYRCTVGSDCNTMTCAFTGGTAPATFKRLQ